MNHALTSCLKLCLFLAVFFRVASLNSQELLQLNSYYGSGNHFSKSTRFSDSGSFYLAGQFSGEVNIGLNNVSSSSRSGVYFSKQFADGTSPFLKYWTGSGSLSISSMFVKGDSVIAVGMFSDSLFLENDTLVNVGMKGGYMIILDTLGNVIRSWHLNSYSAEIHDVRFSSQGYILMCGEFYNTMTIDGQVFNAPLGFNSFAIKMDPLTLESVWVRTSEGTGTNARKIGSDKFDNIYITGSYGNGTSFEGQVLSEVTGDHNAYTVSYNANGDLNWVKTIKSSVQSHGISQAVSDNGDVYVGGEFEMNLEITPSVSYSNAALMDAFYIKWDRNGNHMWSGTAGGSEQDVLEDIVLDQNGDPLFLFNGGALNLNGTIVPTEGFRAPALVKMDRTSGNAVWNYRIPVAPSTGIAEAYSIDVRDDQISLCGSNRTGLFYFGEVLDSPNLDDSFWALIKDTLFSSSTNSMSEIEFEKGTMIFPSPAVAGFSITSTNGEQITLIEIFDNKATLIKVISHLNKQVEYNEQLEKGVYHLRITTNHGVYYNKLLKL